jgi:H+/Na+-translocating ferredoxin:NAD+ oxidoreductase subunit B
MSEEIYVKMREFLDKMPGGFPQSDTGVELKILKKLFTPEEAEMTMKLSMMPETAEALAPKLGLNEKEAGEKLEALAQNGLIYRAKLGGKLHYMAISYVVGIYEFQLGRIDKEFSELTEEYMPYITKMMQSVKTKQLRTVPIHSAVEESTTVASYDKIRELVKNKKKIGVMECICTKERKLLDDPCQMPVEKCISFDLGAQYFIDNGHAREITQDELMDLLKLGEEKAWVLNTTNAEQIMSICMCCGCCCGVLRGLKKLDRPVDSMQVAFQANIDPDLCSACGTCEERCQVDAIEDGDVYKVDTGRCIGCGLCVSTCPEEAVSMAPGEGLEPLPKNMVDMTMKIAKDRGLM